jgi:hypothetical protein
MYEQYLGDGYHDKIRQMLYVKDDLVTNVMIDAPANIGAMQKIIAPHIDEMILKNIHFDTEEKFSFLLEAAQNALCGVLCVAIRSRLNGDKFGNIGYRYKHMNFEKKQAEFMGRVHKKFIALLDYVEEHK